MPFRGFPLNLELAARSTPAAASHPANRLPGFSFIEYGALIEPTIPDGVAVYTVDEFLVRNRISRGFFYKLLKQGNGPRVMRPGGRTLISAAAERDWHRQLETKSAK